MILKLRKKPPGQNKPPRDQLMPPEGVPLTMQIAGVGVRLGAQTLDIVLTVLAFGSFMVVLAFVGITGPHTITAIGALLFFAIRVPYYILTELLWNGQTLGKRIMKIKVVSHDGGPLTTHALVLRNMMKEAEVFLPGTLVLMLDADSPVASLLAFGWILTCLLIPAFDRYKRRLGDMMAGTHVIHLPVPVLLKDLASEARVLDTNRKEFVFLSHQLDHYGAFELQTLETLLRAQSSAPGGDSAAQRAQTIAAIVEKIRKKIGYAQPVPPADRLKFLQAFYKAQREHLEQRQLFGDRRQNKHYATEGNGS